MALQRIFQPLRNEPGDPCLTCGVGRLSICLAGSCRCGHPNAHPPCSVCENSFLICDVLECQEPAHESREPWHDRDGDGWELIDDEWISHRYAVERFHLAKAKRFVMGIDLSVNGDHMVLAEYNPITGKVRLR